MEKRAIRSGAASDLLICGAVRPGVDNALTALRANCLLCGEWLAQSSRAFWRAVDPMF